MLKGNDIVALRCEGALPGDRFLNGATHINSTSLVATSDLPFSGTWWRTHNAGDGTMHIECIGHLPGNRFLDGQTQNGRVSLAPNSNAPFTGTRWRVHDAGQDLTRLESLGHLAGNRFLDGHTHDGTVGLAPNVGAPFSGTLWRVFPAVINFTFADDISLANVNRLLDRHRLALASVVACNRLSLDEKFALHGAYRRVIHHTTLVEDGVNASANVGGSTLNVNFGILFPQGDEEISQTLIHEMMHCAGFSHPVRRDPPAGSSCATPDPSKFDCPNDNGRYYGTPALRAEFCIAGDQSDVRGRLARKAASESCIVDAEGLATIYQR